MPHSIHGLRLAARAVVGESEGHSSLSTNGYLTQTIRRRNVRIQIFVEDPDETSDALVCGCKLWSVEEKSVFWTAEHVTSETQVCDYCNKNNFSRGVPILKVVRLGAWRGERVP